MSAHPPRKGTVYERHVEDCSQIEDMAKAVGWRVDCQQLGAGKLSARFLSMNCERLNLNLQCANKEIVTWASPPKEVVPFVFPLSSGPFGLFQGRRLGENHSFVTAAGQEGVFRPGAEVARCTVGMSKDCFEAALWRHERLEFDWDAGALVVEDHLADALPRLRGRISKAFFAGTNGMPVEGFDEEIIQVVVEMLSGGRRDGRVGLGMRNRLILVRKARGYMEERLSECLRIATVADEFDVSGRTLELAFQEILGMRPVEYLQKRRLRMARRILCRKEDGRKVGEVALSCGILHLGYFSRNYNNLFGERPSETLRTAGSVVVSGSDWPRRDSEPVE